MTSDAVRRGADLRQRWSRIWPKVRRVWVTVGTLVFIVFTVWSLLAYRATAHARAELHADGRATVERGAGYWLFKPRAPAQPAGLLFFPGALVDPVAYAPLAHDVARAGYAAVLVELPRRGAFAQVDGPEQFARARIAMAPLGEVGGWVVAGHSLGGRVAATMAHEDPSGLVGLVLIGTSHPRDFSLAATHLPVTRVYGTRDTVADVEKLERTRSNLPASTRMVRIDGGNHSQFGWYGFQPGDWPATISRAAQYRLTLEAVIAALASASAALHPQVRGLEGSPRPGG